MKQMEVKSYMATLEMKKLPKWQKMISLFSVFLMVATGFFVMINVEVSGENRAGDTNENSPWANGDTDPTFETGTDSDNDGLLDYPYANDTNVPEGHDDEPTTREITPPHLEPAFSDAKIIDYANPDMDVGNNDVDGYDIDADSLPDGHELSGWYVFWERNPTAAEKASGKVTAENPKIEIQYWVFSNPLLPNADDDDLNDTEEYRSGGIRVDHEGGEGDRRNREGAGDWGERGCGGGSWEGGGSGEVHPGPAGEGRILEGGEGQVECVGRLKNLHGFRQHYYIVIIVKIT